MQVPGLPSLVFLAWVLLILPWMAFRSAWRLKFLTLRDELASFPRKVIWSITGINQVILLALALLVGASFGYQPFAAPPSFDGMDVLAAFGALTLCSLVSLASRVIRTDKERHKMIVYKLSPRTKREWLLWTLLVLLGAIGEEIAYRGVAMSILWYSLGNPWISVLICSIAFGAAHWVQGWKSALLIVVFALVMHALVAITQTLLVAMAVHAIYNIVSGYRISRESIRSERLEIS